MSDTPANDPDAIARLARFGTLPERIRPEDMTLETEADPAGASGGYHPESAWNFYSCVALDLGL
ncbi:hypothetical protein ABTY59_20150 [Streptomyces sp. NPDC096079]|uniref:hypothetical protein n=1 Tax=unclassified Streptomyces TaxID=2593676 RepID=UPI00331B6E08